MGNVICYCFIHIYLLFYLIIFTRRVKNTRSPTRQSRENHACRERVRRPSELTLTLQCHHRARRWWDDRRCLSRHLKRLCRHPLRRLVSRWLEQLDWHIWDHKSAERDPQLSRCRGVVVVRSGPHPESIFEYRQFPSWLCGQAIPLPRQALHLKMKSVRQLLVSYHPILVSLTSKLAGTH